MGTGNLLARNLGVSLGDPAQALRVALTGVNRSIDVGCIQPTTQGGRVERFATMAGIGFDAALMRDAPETLKARIGWAAYLVSSVRHLRGTSMRVVIRIDDGAPISARARTVMIGNIGRLIGGLQLFPGARPDDGMLDVAVIDGHGLLDWLTLLGRVITGRTDVDHRYMTYQGKQVRVTSRSTQPRQVDGDIIDPNRQLTVQIEAAALIVKVPPGDVMKDSGEDRP